MDEFAVTAGWGFFALPRDVATIRAIAAAAMTAIKGIDNRVRFMSVAP
jgi:hypothetical protein